MGQNDGNRPECVAAPLRIYRIIETRVVLVLFLHRRLFLQAAAYSSMQILDRASDLCFLCRFLFIKIGSMLIHPDKIDALGTTSTLKYILGTTNYSKELFIRLLHAP